MPLASKEVRAAALSRIARAKPCHGATVWHGAWGGAGSTRDTPLKTLQNTPLSELFPLSLVRVKSNSVTHQVSAKKYYSAAHVCLLYGAVHVDTPRPRYLPP